MEGLRCALSATESIYGRYADKIKELEGEHQEVKKKIEVAKQESISNQFPDYINRLDEFEQDLQKMIAEFKDDAGRGKLCELFARDISTKVVEIYQNLGDLYKDFGSKHKSTNEKSDAMRAYEESAKFYDGASARYQNAQYLPDVIKVMADQAQASRSEAEKLRAILAEEKRFRELEQRFAGGEKLTSEENAFFLSIKAKRLSNEVTSGLRYGEVAEAYAKAGDAYLVMEDKVSASKSYSSANAWYAMLANYYKRQNMNLEEEQARKKVQEFLAKSISS